MFAIQQLSFTNYYIYEGDRADAGGAFKVEGLKLKSEIYRDQSMFIFLCILLHKNSINL